MSSDGMNSRRSSGMQRSLLAIGAMLVLIAGLSTWSAGLNGPYQFDDYVTPLGDPASQSLDAWGTFLPRTLRPATKLSYALEAEAGLSGQPAARRVVSFMLFALAAVLLGLLIARLEPRAAPFGALMLAAVWFLHPVQADSVLLLSGRTALLSAVFLLIALLALERSRPLLSAILFVLACLARETALAGLLPLAALAASRPGVSTRSVLRELSPILAGAALALLWMLTTPRYLQLAEFSLLGRPFWHSFFSQVGAVPLGLDLLLHPVRLSVDYGLPLPGKATDPLFLFGLGLYLAAAAGIVLLLRRSRIAAVGLALWLAALLPTQSLIPKLDALSNRPLSLALAGLLLLAAPILLTAFEGVRGKASKSAATGSAIFPAGPGLAAGVVALALLVPLAGASVQRAELFRTELSLWQDAAAKSSANPRPHMQYAALLHRAGRNREAREALSAAQAIDPFSSQIAAMAKVYQPEEVSQ